jgi:hypothetical protein
MTGQPPVTPGPPMMGLEVATPELPLTDLAGHNEWLLDEALAETFPASDSIAVSSYSPNSEKPV